MGTSPSNLAARPLLLGHRGLRRRGLCRLNSAAPTENSLAAFEMALSSGCDGFEFDVRHTRDGRNVLWHDPEWNGRKIAATNFTALTDGAASGLATLEEVLRQFGNRAFLDIELKSPGREAAVVVALDAKPPQRGFLVSSFFPEILTRIHDLDANIPLAFLCDRSEAMDVWRDLPIKVFLPHHEAVVQKLIAEAHERGQQIMSWTVNSQRRMQQLANWGIDGLISDDPQLLYQTFHSD